jgi:hypothetical protein
VIVVSVSDNGPGIAPDELPHVFERFYRTRHSRQHYSGGTGLGLTICKAFIEAHGNVIWAESSVRGTTISFSLPLTASDQVGNGAGASELRQLVNEAGVSTAMQSDKLQGMCASHSSDQSASVSPAVPVETAVTEIPIEEGGAHDDQGKAHSTRRR